MLDALRQIGNFVVRGDALPAIVTIQVPIARQARHKDQRRPVRALEAGQDEFAAKIVAHV